MGRIIKQKNNPVIAPDELDQQAVGTAIVIMHGEGRYYEAMDILCRVVGWPPLVRGVPVKAAKEVKAKRRKGETCGRWFDPLKILQRKSANACHECGRGYRKERTK